MNKTARTLQTLRDHESRNITFIDPEGGWPIVWQRAKGVHVWDAEGRKYLDLTAAFGVANAGHSNRAVVRAGQRQMAELLHAMGDVHPHSLKAELARELSRITFERWNPRSRGKVIFCNSGFEAVEAALKTARLATGKDGIIAFEGGYHGLGYGALNATHRSHFRKPFEDQLGAFGQFVPFPLAGDNPARALRACEAAMKRVFATKKIGAVLVEPIQARGGINIPPRGFLRMLRKLCGKNGALLILDEIYTGFGRTGRWFACEHEDVAPDLICLGKAMTGGFPMSACVGRTDVMDAAWPPSNGEAIHTSTFLGHPVGCAMALEQLKELRRLKLPQLSAVMGKALLAMLIDLRPESAEYRYEVRGVGLMAGLEIRRADGSPASVEAIQVIKAMLKLGFVMLPEGEHGNVISFTPPLSISRTDLTRSVRSLAKILQKLLARSPLPHRSA